MKILYSAYSQIPSDFANSIAVMKQCGALNHKAELRVILVKGQNSGDVFSAYGVEPFSLVLLPKWVLLFQELGLKLFVVLYALLYRPDMVYSRDVLLNQWLCWFHIDNIYEIHQLTQSDPKFDRLFKKLLAKIVHRAELKAIVSVSARLAERCVEFGVPEEKITVLHSGVDLKECAQASETTAVAFGDNRPLAVYVGSLQKGKGIDLIQQMAEITKDYNFLIVGGERGKVRESGNLKHIPRVPHHCALAYMKQADFLLLPLTEQSYQFHSPLKLFEYLSVGKPVIASDNADVREVITHMENGMLANPAQPEDFIEKMNQVRKDAQLKERLEKNAPECAKQFTWEARAEKIMNLIRNLCHE